MNAPPRTEISYQHGNRRGRNCAGYVCVRHVMRSGHLARRARGERGKKRESAQCFVFGFFSLVFKPLRVGASLTVPCVDGGVVKSIHLALPEVCSETYAPSGRCRWTCHRMSENIETQRDSFPNLRRTYLSLSPSQTSNSTFFSPRRTQHYKWDLDRAVDAFFDGSWQNALIDARCVRASRDLLPHQCRGASLSLRTLILYLRCTTARRGRVVYPLHITAFNSCFFFAPLDRDLSCLFFIPGGIITSTPNSSLTRRSHLIFSLLPDACFSPRA